MDTRFPAHHLSEFNCLSEGEIETLRTLEGASLLLPRRSVIRPEGSRDRSIYFLIEGWASSSMMLAHGKRHILRVHLPGEILGGTSMCVDHAVDTLTALTPVRIRKVSLETIGSQLKASPNIAAFLLLSAQKERIALMDRQACLAQSSSSGRLAAVLLAINDRLSAAGSSRDNRLSLPITQEEMGDIVGLTAVHVNRTLRKFERDGLIARRLRAIELLDVERLRNLAGTPARALSSACGWFRTEG